MRQTFRFALVVFLLLTLHPKAHADTVTTFTLTSDTFSYTGAGVVPGPSGHIVINTTTGTILGGDLSVSDEPYYSYLNVPIYALDQGIFGAGVNLYVEGAYLQDAEDNLQFFLTFPLAYDTSTDNPTLAGYTGGSLCGQFVSACYYSDYASFLYVYYPPPSEDQSGAAEVIFMDGELTPETTVVTTPEPSTLLLLSTGTLGMAALLRKRLSTL